MNGKAASGFTKENIATATAMCFGFTVDIMTNITVEAFSSLLTNCLTVIPDIALNATSANQLNAFAKFQALQCDFFEKLNENIFNGLSQDRVSQLSQNQIACLSVEVFSGNCKFSAALSARQTGSLSDEQKQAIQKCHTRIFRLHGRRN